MIERVRNAVSDGRASKFVRRYSSQRRLPTIYGYIDFSRLESISTAVAVVLAAEYQRAAFRIQEVPPTIDLDSWTPAVFTRLFQLGFFETVGLSKDVAERFYDEGQTRTMRIVSGTNSSQALSEIDKQLQTLGEFIDEARPIGGDLIVPLLSSISEATTNVTQHAYALTESSAEDFARFWIAATADRIKRTLTIVVYDQGSTIPITFPRAHMSGRVKRVLSRLLRRRAYGIQESDYIAAALRYGNSRTDLPNRGKGLPQMRQLIQSLGRGRLFVRSGRGWCMCGPGRAIESGESEARLGGTLIEWNLELS